MKSRRKPDITKSIAAPYGTWKSPISLEMVAHDREGLWEPQILLADNDFHSSPCLSPDGKLLAWLYWDHPNMPRGGTELWTAPFHADGSLGEATFVAGGVDLAVIQPEWCR